MLLPTVSLFLGPRRIPVAVVFKHSTMGKGACECVVCVLFIVPLIIGSVLVAQRESIEFNIEAAESWVSGDCLLLYKSLNGPYKTGRRLGQDDDDDAGRRLGQDDDNDNPAYQVLCVCVLATMEADTSRGDDDLCGAAFHGLTTRATPRGARRGISSSSGGGGAGTTIETNRWCSACSRSTSRATRTRWETTSSASRSSSTRARRTRCATRTGRRRTRPPCSRGGTDSTGALESRDDGPPPLPRPAATTRRVCVVCGGSAKMLRKECVCKGVPPLHPRNESRS